ncbi:rod shape-determining protein MreC [Winogradskyella sp. 3972H.M.0a.05]|uniref:rod shape-determining protein MreC n=1 Tax=Winogradskyella sp. 3972H.M.0a.05 TaxID=2950277 RepID=UPI00339B7275
MQQIINFILRNKTFLTFLLLFGISLILIVQSHSYHKSKVVNSANFLSGGLYESTNAIKQFFNLRHENEVLLEENNRLKSLLFNNTNEIDSTVIDTNALAGNYKFTPASVYKNSYSASNNYLLVNKGQNDGVKQDFGVITSKGIVGIIDNTSANYATVQSILNTLSRINAKLKKSDHSGSLKWNTTSPEYVQLEDVNTFAPVTVGDTIITGGQSSIFPKGVPIGVVDSFEIDISGDTYIIQVKLFNDMTNIGHVYIIENVDLEEIRVLEESIDE